MGLKLIPELTTIPFTKGRIPAFILSSIAVIAAIWAYITIGLNFGIDFKGGVTVEVGPGEGQATFSSQQVNEVRSAAQSLELGDVKVQEISGLNAADAKGMVVFVEQQQVAEGEGPAEEGAIEVDASGVVAPSETGDKAESAQQIAAGKIQQVLRDTLGEDIKFRRVDVVGPKVSGELVEAGTRAVILAVIFMLAYIWFRFEWQFSVGAVVALVHDVILTIGMFAITGLEFNLSIIAALLTIVGYSMNDTVVVYDRVRENLRKYKKKELAEVLDLSVNETLSRTIMTSLTTLLALGSLFLFGGDVLRGFTAAMIWGVVIGTYSSVFIASPILLVLGVKRDWSKVPTTATA